MSSADKGKTSTTAPADSNSSINQENDISMHDFLEFLKTACLVNDLIFFGDRNCTGEQINYDDLAKNELVNNLLGNVFKERMKELFPPNTDDMKKLTEKPISSAKETIRRRSSTTLPSTKFAANKSKSDANYGKGIHPVLKEKLNEVINEGILDSVLPFICPAHPQIVTSTVPSNLTVNTKSGKSKSRDISPNIKQTQPQHTISTGTSLLEVVDSKKASPYSGNDVDLHRSPRLSDGSIKIKENKGAYRRKSLGVSHSGNDDKKAEAEVIIHVCDEVKNTSKDFSCPQNLLVSKMGYFADVTAGQKLEDMDISVHCDIQIFDWLMKWVKKDTHIPLTDSNSNSPQLDATNVVPILVSASFLQMEPLLLDCLSFCHSRLNDVVRSSTNLSCLNDSIITRLAAMFTNLELEMVKDKKERVTPRLWTKLISSLMEPEPQALRGHYFSLAGLFRCSKCGKYLTQSSSTYVYCISSNMRLNRWGQLVSQHVRDTAWDMNHYISTLYKELKSWRKVYWKLWGHCHFLYCCICETHFAAYQVCLDEIMNWCQYHPETPQYLGPLTEGHVAGPAGRFPCCGQQAFRYESLIGPNGCQFREHSVLVETDRDRAILTLAQIAAEGSCLYEPPHKNPSNNNNNYEPKWIGMSLMPTKCRQGLLPALHVEEYNSKLVRRVRQGAARYEESSSETESSETTTDRSRRFTNRQFSTSSDGCESESSSPRNYKSNGRRRAKTFGRYWCGEVSARSNQDNQREFEERVMKQIVSMVGKRTGNENNLPHQNYQNGGSYVRLEADWKEQIRQKNFNKAKIK